MLTDRDLDVQLGKAIPYLIYAPKEFRDEIASLVKDICAVWREGAPETFQKYCEELDERLKSRKRFTRKMEYDISTFAERNLGFHQRITEVREELADFKKELTAIKRVQGRDHRRIKELGKLAGAGDKAVKGKIRRRRWSEEEDKILREGYPILPKEEVRREMEKRLSGRTWRAIKLRGHRMGLKRRRD